MRVARALSVWVATATMAWSLVLSGGALAQDTTTPFRPACELLTTDAVSALLGVDVTPADGWPYAACSYLHAGDEVAGVYLSPSPPFVLRRIGPSGATDVTVGGLPALSRTGGGGSSSTPASVIVRLVDGGTLEVNVETEAGVADPDTAARALADAILATGPLTAHTSTSPPAEPIRPSGLAVRAGHPRRAQADHRPAIRRCRARCEPGPVQLPHQGSEGGGIPQHRGWRSRRPAQQEHQEPDGQ